MGRENAETKGRRYLTEGRLTVEWVDGAEIRASCLGAGQVYRLGYVPGGWACDCPAFGRCAHLVALQLVTLSPRVRAADPLRSAVEQLVSPVRRGA
jgi:uncharacterized Zn finger protein